MSREYLIDHLFGFVSVVRFLPDRTRYFRKLETASADPALVPYLDTLKRDGVAVVPDFLPVDVIAEMRAAVPDLADFEESPEGDRAFMYREADRLAAMRPFFHNAFVSGIARSYISRDAIPLRQTIGLKTVLGLVPTFEMNYHMDTWKHRLKAFLYLEDVGPDNAPTVYLKGSHRGRWRYSTEARHFRHFRTDDRGFAGGEDVFYLGSFWPHEVAQLKRDYGYEDLVCTAKAGSLLLFDGRGLHRATPLRADRRLILISYWIHPGEHV